MLLLHLRVLEFLKSIDQKLLLFLNGQHNTFFDFVMYWASDRFIWIPFYLLLLFFVVKKFGKKAYLVLVLVAAMIAVSDQVSSGLVKNMVQRLRPCHDPEIQDRVHLVEGVCGGSFGFYSSHASNTWALALFLILIFKHRMRAGATRTNESRDGLIPLYAALVVYASLVSYSRIYLGTHYPFDVLTGVATGTILSFIFARVFSRFGGLKN